MSAIWRKRLKMLLGIVFAAGSFVLLLVNCSGAVKSTRENSYYTVRYGDSLYAIAWRYKLDVKKLASWNNISSPYPLSTGQKIHLNPPKNLSIKALKQERVSNAVTPPAKRASTKASKPRTTPKKKPASVNSRPVVWHWPVNGKVLKPYSSEGVGKKGIDILGDPGQTIQASSGGKVVYSGSGLIGYGQLIIIKHDEEYLSAYAHVHKLLVKEGQSVAAKQKIAELDQSGANHPKLHFEIRRYGKPVDPQKYLPRKSH